jgi:hypothetical protein
MTRRLLPYEHQLIAELGISEQEYLNFVQAQFDHTKLPADKLKTPQNDPATVALVLTIVGVLFQVGAALLAPKPELPSQQNQRRRRDQTFSPRFGFNSSQELAKYGDPVNLVYCNTDQNTTGGVRVNTSMVWSAVKSFGSSQFMQMAAVIGASNIDPAGIDVARTAFGQATLRQMAAQKYWLYLRQNGILRFSDLRFGSGTDPTAGAEAASSFVYKASLAGATRTEGFSQAFSPSTATRCGVTAPIPINVLYLDRDERGSSNLRADLGIELNGRGGYWPDNKLDNSRPAIPVGTVFTLRFKPLSSSGASDVRQAASELRRTLLSSIDAASTYKLGSAKLRVKGQITDLELDNDATNIDFECIESGVCPNEDYGTLTYKANEKEASDEIARLNTEIQVLRELLSQTPPLLTPSAQARIDQINSRVAEINALIDSIEELRDRKWTTEEIEAITSDDGSIYDPVVIHFANKVEDARERRRLFQVYIDDELDKPAAQRNRAAIRSWKEEIRAVNRRLKNITAKLDEAIRQYGFADNGKGRSLREDRKAKLRRIQKLNEEIGAIYGDSGNVDAAATEARANGWRAQIAALEVEKAYYQSVIDNPELQNDFFDTKCMVKIEEASYETITPCRIVDFALKARVFKRVQGRAKTYGEVETKTYKDSDNGYKLRSMFFWVLYRRTGGAWVRVPRIFVIRRGADQDNYTFLKFIAGDNIGNWQFKFEPIAETAAEMRYYGLTDFAYVENAGTVQNITGPAGGTFTFTGKLRTRDGYLAPINRNPSEIDEWSLFSMRSDTQLNFSFDNGPELEIKAVTEQSTEAFSNYPQLYSNLTMLGFNVYSGQGVQDLRSMSVFVNKGRLVRRLNDDGSYSSTPDTATSLAPEIFLDTILDTVDGIGQFAKIEGIDLPALALAKRFCQRNNLFFDGVIAEPTAWRQFWAEVGPYSLLELGRIGGKETLIPAVPCDNSGNITRTVPIRAMFTAGNILEDSYKEEFIDYGSSVQDLIATVIYRNTERDGVFPRNASVDVNLVGVTEATAIRQTFDLSQYVTNRSQAIMYAKLLCQQRRNIRRNIEFKTFPTDSPLSPGAYIYVDAGLQEWQGIYSGQIESGGALNIPLADAIPNGSYSVLLYRDGQSVITTTASISSNVASSLAGYEGWLFVLGTPAKAKRTFRVVEVQMDEEGEVSVRAVEHPCDNSGQSLIADFSDGLFTIR